MELKNPIRIKKYSLSFEMGGPASINSYLSLTSKKDHNKKKINKEKIKIKIKSKVKKYIYICLKILLFYRIYYLNNKYLVNNQIQTNLKSKINSTNPSLILVIKFEK